MSNFNEHGLPCPVNWGDMPKWANHVAVDANGGIYIYQEKPTLYDQTNSLCWAFPSETSYLLRFKKLGTVAKPADFTQCLWKRPE